MKKITNQIRKSRNSKLVKNMLKKSNTMTVMVGEGDHKQELEVEWKPTSWDENEYRWFDKDGIEFDGHRELFSLELEEYNYLKESDLSGDEWRKGGTAKIYRNGQCVWEDFFRDIEYGIKNAWRMLDAAKEFYHWDDVKVGKKLYYMDMPCYIEYIRTDGYLVINRDNDELFPLKAYDQEDLKEGMYEEDLFDRESVIVSMFDDNIWWWREEEDNEEE